MKQEFQVHMLNDQGIAQATAIGEAFSECLEKLQTLLAAGREMSLVVTKLQEAAFFAKRGIAINPANQKAAT